MSKTKEKFETKLEEKGSRLSEKDVTNLIDEFANLFFMLSSPFTDAAYFSLAAASLFIFLDSTSMAFVSA
jgi:hypothetical protein